MKKNGYTLAEVMITLGIIGVLAAIMLPLVNKFKPDPVKSMYLNTYDALVQAINTATSNESIYPIYPVVNSDRNYSNRILFSNRAVDTDGIKIASGGNKLCRVLSYAFQNGVTNGACTDTFAAANANFTSDFESKNGVQFMVRRVTGDYYETDIYIDVNGADGNNCIYNPDSCPAPDRFKFYVGVNGKMIPADPMGKHYLATRTNLKVQKDAKIDNTAIAFPEDMKTTEAKITFLDRMNDGYIKLIDTSIDLSKFSDFELNEKFQSLIDSGAIEFKTKE